MAKGKEKEIKTIGVLTSGGDASGMNAAIRAVVRKALANGKRVVGIQRGYAGLLNEEISEMQRNDVSEIIQRGGTILRTARCEEFKYEEGQAQAADICKKHGIDGIVVIGGDGSYRGAQALSKHGINTIGVPGTIDLDISCTLWCGVANGAENILLPEKYDFNEQAIIDDIIAGRKRGKTHHLIINAEGIGHSTSMARRIEAATGIETRATILGYMQRGGAPTCKDRYYASMMGAYAADLLCEGKSNRVVAFKHGEFVDFDIDEALAMTKTIDEYEYQVSRIL